MFVSFSKLFRNVQTGQVSSVFYDEDFLPRKLTVNREFLRLRPDSSGRLDSSHTLFEEIQVLRPMWNYALKDRTTGPADIVAAVEKVIVEHWHPSKFHLVFHSAGYDSRLISGLLRRLKAERGAEWLGDVLFACTKWEGKEFKQIMRYQGWEPEEWIVVRENRSDADYYSDAISFETIFRQGGVTFQPVNFFYWIVEALQAASRIPCDEGLQSWSAGFANEGIAAAMKGKSDIVRRLKSWYTSCEMGSFVFRGQMRFPFLHTSVLEAEQGLLAVIRGGRKYPVKFLQILDPRLAELAYVDFAGDKGQVISDVKAKELCEAYRDSWYARHVGPANCRHAVRRIQFHVWWRDVSAASLCDYLIQRTGREICLQ